MCWKKFIIVTKIAFVKYNYVFHCKWQNTFKTAKSYIKRSLKILTYQPDIQLRLS